METSSRPVFFCGIFLPACLSAVIWCMIDTMSSVIEWRYEAMHIKMEKFEKKSDMYASLAETLASLLDESVGLVANLANISALLKLVLEDVNWAGFYLMETGALTLGPFQGRPAVTRIEIGRGVCGMAAAERKTQVIEDVHICENHIVCDVASASEIVVPIIKRGDAVLGVLDIDSPITARFDCEDARGLEKLTAIIAEKLW